MDITLNELAERIRPTGGDLTTIIERLKHWTKQDILRPANRPQRGVPRLYEPTTVVSAGLLNCLAGGGVLVFGGIEDALGLLRTEADRWARGERRQCWLELAWAKMGPSGSVRVAKMHYGELTLTKGTTMAVVVNVAVLLAQVRWGTGTE